MSLPDGFTIDQMVLHLCWEAGRGWSAEYGYTAEGEHLITDYKASLPELMEALRLPLDVEAQCPCCGGFGWPPVACDDPDPGRYHPTAQHVSVDIGLPERVDCPLVELWWGAQP